MEHRLKTTSIGFVIPMENITLEKLASEEKFSEAISKIVNNYPSNMDTISSDVKCVELPEGNTMIIFTYIARYNYELIPARLVNEIIDNYRENVINIFSEYLKDKGIVYKLVK